MKLIICKSCFEYLTIEFLLNKKSANIVKLQDYMKKRMQIDISPDTSSKCVEYLEKKGVVKTKKNRYEIVDKDVRKVLADIHKTWMKEWDEEIELRKADQSLDLKILPL